MDTNLESLIKTNSGKKNILEHGIRVGQLVLKLAEAAGAQVDPIDLIISAKFHDIGKTFLPEDILNKPGALEDYEYSIIKVHPALSYKVLKIQNQNEDVLQGVLYHHEDFAGTGYFNLKGNEIPLAARIIRIADTWDVLTCERPYKKAYSMEKALEIMEETKSSYDPNLFYIFKKHVLNLS